MYKNTIYKYNTNQELKMAGMLFSEPFFLMTLFFLEVQKEGKEVGVFSLYIPFAIMLYMYMTFLYTNFCISLLQSEQSTYKWASYSIRTV